MRGMSHDPKDVAQRSGRALSPQQKRKARGVPFRQDEWDHIARAAAADGMKGTPWLRKVGRERADAVLGGAGVLTVPEPLWTRICAGARLHGTFPAQWALRVLSDAVTDVGPDCEDVATG